MARTRIKICGLTRVEDVQAVVAAGVGQVVILGVEQGRGGADLR